MRRAVKAGLMLVATIGCVSMDACRIQATAENALYSPAADKEEENVSSASVKGKSEHYRATATIDIAAPAASVWQAIHDERDYDPDVMYNKVISQSDPSALVPELVLEQKYRHVPIFGTAVCRLRNVEIPGKRIDYSLAYSDHFKSWDGSWVLTPTGVSTTRLELSSFLDTGFPIPKMLYKKFAVFQLQKRLNLVKRLAEQQL
jgi:hypothetical protein